MKKNIGTNLGTLLNTNPTAPTPTKAQEPEQETPTGKVKGNYKTVSYSIPPATADKIRQIAEWDGRKLNAVVTEAFELYAQNWKPRTYGEPPKF